MKQVDEDHLIDIVNEDDNVIGKDKKENKFSKELISRNVVAFLKNENNKYIIVKRSPKKKNYPNLLDLAACGHVHLGESYEEAIVRKIKEELGGSVSNLKLLKKVYHEHIENRKSLRYFISIFTGIYKEKIILSKELSSYELFDRNSLKKKISKNPEQFSPFFVDEYKIIEKDLK